MTSYLHGVYSREVPTSIRPPVTALAGLPVVVGAAPSKAESLRRRRRLFVLLARGRPATRIIFPGDWPWLREM
ncbi:MAG: hypothetical protein FJ125_06945 [Deltaproteobacteria bacterium]|nr:hypothetical protein [Deltaproteobacteria bacterium]